MPEQKTAYCTKCRANIEVDWASPPYAVMQKVSRAGSSDEQHSHCHPITRAVPLGPEDV